MRRDLLTSLITPNRFVTAIRVRGSGRHRIKLDNWYKYYTYDFGMIRSLHTSTGWMSEPSIRLSRKFSPFSLALQIGRLRKGGNPVDSTQETSCVRILVL